MSEEVKKRASTELSAYLKKKRLTQEALGKKLGIRQSNISGMLRKGRKIDVVEYSNGVIELREKLDRLVATSLNGERQED